MTPIPTDQISSHEPLAYRVRDACKMAGIGKSLLYELAKAGEIKFTKIRGRTLVSRAELERLIAAGQRAA